MAWPTVPGVVLVPDGTGRFKHVSIDALPQRFSRIKSLISEKVGRPIAGLLCDGTPVEDHAAWQRLVLSFWSTTATRQMEAVQYQADCLKDVLQTGTQDSAVSNALQGVWELASRADTLDIAVRLLSRTIKILHNPQLRLSHFVAAGVVATFATYPKAIDIMMEEDVLSALFAARQAAFAVGSTPDPRLEEHIAACLSRLCTTEDGNAMVRQHEYGPQLVFALVLSRMPPARAAAVTTLCNWLIKDIDRTSALITAPNLRLLLGPIEEQLTLTNAELLLQSVICSRLCQTPDGLQLLSKEPSVVQLVNCLQIIVRRLRECRTDPATTNVLAQCLAHTACALWGAKFDFTSTADATHHHSYHTAGSSAGSRRASAGEVNPTERLLSLLSTMIPSRMPEIPIGVMGIICHLTSRPDGRHVVQRLVDKGLVSPLLHRAQSKIHSSPRLWFCALHAVACIAAKANESAMQLLWDEGAADFCVFVVRCHMQESRRGAGSSVIVDDSMKIPLLRAAAAALMFLCSQFGPKRRYHLLEVISSLLAIPDMTTAMYASFAVWCIAHNEDNRAQLADTDTARILLRWTALMTSVAHNPATNEELQAMKATENVPVFQPASKTHQTRAKITPQLLSLASEARVNRSLATRLHEAATAALWILSPHPRHRSAIMDEDGASVLIDTLALPVSTCATVMYMAMGSLWELCDDVVAKEQCIAADIPRTLLSLAQQPIMGHEARVFAAGFMLALTRDAKPTVVNDDTAFQHEQVLVQFMSSEDHVLQDYAAKVTAQAITDAAAKNAIGHLRGPVYLINMVRNRTETTSRIAALHALLNLSTDLVNQDLIGRYGVSVLSHVFHHDADEALQLLSARVLHNIGQHPHNRSRLYREELHVCAQEFTVPSSPIHMAAEPDLSDAPHVMLTTGEAAKPPPEIATHFSAWYEQLTRDKVPTEPEPASPATTRPNSPPSPVRPQSAAATGRRKPLSRIQSAGFSRPGTSTSTSRPPTASVAASPTTRSRPTTAMSKTSSRPRTASSTRSGPSMQQRMCKEPWNISRPPTAITVTAMDTEQPPARGGRKSSIVALSETLLTPTDAIVPQRTLLTMKASSRNILATAKARAAEREKIAVVESASQLWNPDVRQFVVDPKSTVVMLNPVSHRSAVRFQSHLAEDMSEVSAPREASLQDMFAMKQAVHMAQFEHVEGCRMCEKLFKHYRLPNGKMVHLFHQDPLYELRVESTVDKPPPPLTWAGLHQPEPPAPPPLGLPLATDLPTPGNPPLVIAPRPAGHSLPVVDHVCTGHNCTFFGFLPTARGLQFEVEFESADRGDAGADAGNDDDEGWQLSKSVFKPRVQEVASRDFFDTEAVLYKAFKVDWGRVIAKERVKTLILKAAKNDESEIDQVRHVLWTHYGVLTEAFKYYCARAQGDQFQMNFLSYLEMLENCSISDERSKFCKRRDCEIIFKVVNIEEGTPSEEADANADRALVRFELLETVLRLAVSKYLQGGFTNDVSDAVGMLCERNIEPNLSRIASTVDSNQFRRDRLYCKEVDDVLRPHLPILQAIHAKYCRFKTKVVQLKGARMNLSEWIKLLMDAKLLNEDFTRYEAKMAFVYSKLNVVDELKQLGTWTSLTLVDMLEALARVAEMSSMPTEQDMARVDAADGYQFFVQAEKQGYPLPRRNSSDWNQPKTRPLAEKLARLLELLFGRLDKTGDGKLTAEDLRSWLK